MRFYQLSLLAIICLVCIEASVYKVDPSTQKIIDQNGRINIFHGVNAIYKLPPYYPITDYFDANYSLCEEDFQNLNGWGFNMIRLYIGWQGVEPIQGQYNYTYIEQVRNIVRMAAQYNISILLDAHQDLLSRKFCGEGFPIWALNRTNFPAPWNFNISYEGEYEVPEIPQCLEHPFVEYYLTEDIQNAFNALYTNENGLADGLANMWATVATYFVDEPNVIGYELINEPFGADVYQNPLYLIDSPLNDKDHLAGLYQRIHNAIRAVDNNTIIFFEPSVTDIFSIGLTEGPGGPEYNDRQLLSYHVYCPLVTAEGQPKSALFCHGWDWLMISSRVKAANSLGVAGFMTEFGALSNTNQSAEEVTFLTSTAESYFNSWSYWQFKYYHDITTAANPGTTESFYNQDGSLQLTKIQALSRPYVYAICGTPVSTSFNTETSEFILTLVPSNDCGGMNTEFYLSEEFYYPDGWQVNFVNCGGCSIVSGTTTFLQLPSDWTPNGEVTITITQGT